MSDPSFSIPTALVRVLRKLERTLRVHAALDGFATSLVVIVLLLSIDFAADRFFEFSHLFRIILLPVLAAFVLLVFWKKLFSRLWTPIRRSQLALVLERFVPNLNESLITTVELADPGDDAPSPILMEQTVQKAVESLRGVDLQKCFRSGRLAFRLFAALALVFLLTGLCVAYSETAEIWFSRNILLTQRDWPRRSRLLVDGFQEGRIRIGRGDSLTLTVRADTRMPSVPETIRLRLGDDESGFRNVLLDQFRIDTHEGVDWRVFTYTFTEMLESLPIQVRGSDTTLDDLLIEVVPRPILREIRLRQDFPAYMGREARVITPGLRTMIPEGTVLTVSALSNKALREATVSLNREAEIPLARDPSASSFESIEYKLSPLREDTALLFQLEDTDSLRNRQPIRLEFGVIKDQVPTVTAGMDGIGGAITPVAVIPTIGELADDIGLASARYRYTIRRSSAKDVQEEPATESEESSTEQTEQDIREEGTVEITGLGAGRTIVPLDREFELTPLNLIPGDRLTLHIEAADRYDLDGPEKERFGVSPQWSLEVVTPERLRGLLEVREIAFRQRFEVLIGEVERTRSIVEGFSLDVPEERTREADALPPMTGELTDLDESRKHEELAARRQAFLDTIGQDQAGIGLYDLSRALRDTQKEVYDLRTLVESFRLLRREMINNRIFSDEDRQRLDRGIVDPIQGLIDQDFPEADRLMLLLETTLKNRTEPLRPVGVSQRESILGQFDRLIEKMTSIRDNMVSMESFNEAIEILRSIIRQQQQLRIETQERKSERLKNLLGDD